MLLVNLGIFVLICFFIVVVIVDIHSVVKGYTIPSGFQIVAFIVGGIMFVYVLAPGLFSLTSEDHYRDIQYYHVVSLRLLGCFMFIGLLFMILFFSLNATQQYALQVMVVSMAIVIVVTLITYLGNDDSMSVSGGRRSTHRLKGTTKAR
jgi:uncharacterized membrane protein